MNTFTLLLTDKIVDFIKRLSLKTYFFLKFLDLSTYEDKEVFNLKTQKIPPSNKLLDLFENDLFKLIREIKFRKQFNCFQTKINKDIDDIKNSNKIWVRADKTNNFYKIEPSNYNKIIKNKITAINKLD